MSIDTATYILSGIFLLSGGLSLAAAVMNREWFFTSPSVRAVTGSLPRRRARILYAVIGLAIIAMAIYIYLRVPSR
ncbi:MAG: hypothetical protein K2M02_11550 [Duncaniella sp.]|nr:hypothetical protein [Duncaniella sp.]MDE6495629.1 hypothetical protein [Duncaniella sp.]